jgi:hypothetical protein
MKDGLLTPGIKRPGTTTVFWPEHEIEAILSAEIAGCTAEEIRALVRDLIAGRATMRPAISRQTAQAAE